MPQTHDFSWTLPVMRAGYAGRGLVYSAIAGISLWSIFHGGDAQGTSSIFSTLESSAPGIAVLLAIFAGLMAYAVWRVICAIYDLEAYGDDKEDGVARAGQVITGLIHAAIGIGALLIAVTPASGGGGSKFSQAASWLLSLPGGRFILGAIGLITIGAGLYYLTKAWKEKYRDKLQANHFTANWNWLLKAGVVANGVIIAIIGAFLAYAAVTVDPGQAGGMGKAFDWLSSQAYGRFLVLAICLGLLAFALFCFVNAAYRVIPRVSGASEVETLRERLADRAS